MSIEIQHTAKSKIDSVDFEKLGFGTIMSDYMFECDYKDGKWEKPVIKPYAPITMDPAARVLHYGQAVFEGMKAYKDDNGDLFLFRPEENWQRINNSSERLAMPAFPKEYFIDGLKELVKLETEWVKPGFGNALYLRPFVFATQPALSATPSTEYKFMVICSPVKSYFSGELKVAIQDKYSRSAAGGVGYAKAAGNYAAQFYPQKLAQAKGFQQIVFTDAASHTYIEEGGAMNVMFRIGNKIVTPQTSERILPGITRKSLIQLMEDNGFDIEVRDVKVSEIVEAAKKGELKEFFCCGTAAVISPVSGFAYKDEEFTLPKVDDSYALKLKEMLLNIQYNKSEDKYGWRVKI